MTKKEYNQPINRKRQFFNFFNLLITFKIMITTRKFLLGLSFLAIAGLWTACSNDDEIFDGTSMSEKGISFRTQGGMPELRTTGTTINNIDAFVVYGTDDVAAAKTTPVNIFDGITVAKKAGTTDFEYNPKKYYSAGATDADFVAYSPVSAKLSNFSTANLTDATATASFDYEVVIPNATGNTTQEDLLVAGTRADATSSNAVGFAFQHALSRIFVKATNAMSETVVIKGLELKNLYSTGTITGTLVDPTPPETKKIWTWSWDNHDVVIGYPYVLASSGIAVPAGVSTATLVTSMEQGMMVLPQKTVNPSDDQVFNADDFALEVTYDVANLTGEKAYILLPNGFEFLPNTQYAITVAFSASTTNLIEINFEISVGDFTNDPTTMP